MAQRQAVPDEDIEYYSTAVSLGTAAERVHVNVYKAYKNCKDCIHSMPEPELRELLGKKTSKLRNQFFNNLVPLLEYLVQLLHRLVQLPGCHTLEEQAVGPARYVQRRLVEFHQRRIEIGKKFRLAESIAKPIDGDEMETRVSDFVGVGLLADEPGDAVEGSRAGVEDGIRDQGVSDGEEPADDNEPAKTAMLMEALVD